jgi:hypothetical protein
MFSRLLGSFGFRTTFEVKFEKISSWEKGEADPLSTKVPISHNFFEAEITVKMDSTDFANTFKLIIYGLREDIFNLLNPQQTIVHISLGYADGESKEVIVGLLTEKNLVAGDCWYEATLSGVDYVYERLRRPGISFSQEYKDKTIRDMAQDICQRVHVNSNIAVPGAEKRTFNQTFDNIPPFKALQKIANLGHFSIQAKDGKLWMGNPETLGVTQLTPITDGATSNPVTARSDTPGTSPLDGQNFKVAGNPSLRPSDLVTLGKQQYRIESITHELKREGGYQCWGRALSPNASHDDAQAAARPSATQVARKVGQSLAQRERERPAVSAGDVKKYTAGQHTTTVNLGLDAKPEMVSPSVQAELRSDPVSLPDKPIASPFAFGNCGLMVPIYPKMRTLLAHSWHEPDDAIAAGFMWTAQMKPPPNQQGDWWLCLPTQVDANNGLPSGPTTDDLITKDGQRVIQVKGMKITIGAGLLNSVGSRPSPGSDESLTIQAGQDPKKITKITMKDGEIELTDGSVKMIISSGKISIS